MDPGSLTGRHKRRKDKAERLASVLEGRTDRHFGAAAARHHKKALLLSDSLRGRCLLLGVGSFLDF